MRKQNLLPGTKESSKYWICYVKNKETKAFMNAKLVLSTNNCRWHMLYTVNVLYISSCAASLNLASHLVK